MKDYQAYNTFCMKCQKENAIYRVQEGWERTTMCVNCGIISVTCQKINFKEDKSRGLIDRDSYIARRPERKVG